MRSPVGAAAVSVLATVVVVRVSWLNQKRREA
jgi:hypothetical protein